MAKNLITRAEYKAYANISSTNQDTEIDAIIPKVSQLVKTYCRRTFVDFIDEARTEVFEGGYGSIILKESPVTQVISVQQSTDYGQTYTKLTKFTDWVQSGDYIVSVNPQGFMPYVNGYKISYFAGYETVPEDLKLAVLDLVTYYRKNDGAIHSTKAPGTNAVQIEYISTTSLPAHIKRVLDIYVSDYT
jgi:hypothetical protein